MPFSDFVERALKRQAADEAADAEELGDDATVDEIRAHLKAKRGAGR